MGSYLSKQSELQQALQVNHLFSFLEQKDTKFIIAQQKSIGCELR